jgi:hypothetical protein
MNWTDMQYAISDHIYRHLRLYIFLMSVSVIVLVIIVSDKGRDGVPQTTNMVRVSEDTDNFTVWHDNKRNITCYERYRYLSCIKD